VSGPSIRHFLDLTDIPPRELRGMIETSRAMKKRGRGARAGKSSARKPLAGPQQQISGGSLDLKAPERCVSKYLRMRAEKLQRAGHTTAVSLGV